MVALTRELLAAVLGVALGLFFLSYPEAVVRVHTAGRVPGPRRGEYGTDGAGPRRYRLLVRGVGAVLVVVGLSFGVTALGLR